MALADVLGWTATLLQTVLAVPQLVRLVRTRNVEGLSLVGWQTALVLNLAWTWHGLSIDQLPQTLSSALSLFTTIPILVLMTRELGRSLVRTVLPSVAVAASMIAVGVLGGSGAYGLVAILPGIAITAAQTVELVRADHVRGVSPLSLVLGFLNLSLWLVWAVMVDDSGTVIAVGATWVVAAFNMVWYVLRRLGLRAYFARGIGAAEPVPVAVAEFE